MENWISVKTAVPKDSILKLTYSDRVGKGGVIRLGWYNQYYKEWYFYGIKKKSVTHWMDLPAPPSTIEETT